MVFGVLSARAFGVRMSYTFNFMVSANAELYHIHLSRSFVREVSNPLPKRLSLHLRPTGNVVRCSLLLLIIKHLMIPMRRIHHRIHGIEVCTQPQNQHSPPATEQEEGQNIPMAPSGPISVLAITLTLRSFCTLPIISTAWLSWRCAS